MRRLGALAAAQRTRNRLDGRDRRCCWPSWSRCCCCALFDGWRVDAHALDQFQRGAAQERTALAHHELDQMLPAPARRACRAGTRGAPTRSGRRCAASPARSGGDSRARSAPTPRCAAAPGTRRSARRAARPARSGTGTAASDVRRRSSTPAACRPDEPQQDRLVALEPIEQLDVLEHFEARQRAVRRNDTKPRSNRGRLDRRGCCARWNVWPTSGRITSRWPIASSSQRNARHRMRSMSLQCLFDAACGRPDPRRAAPRTSRAAGRAARAWSRSPCSRHVSLRSSSRVSVHHVRTSSMTIA